MVPTNSRPGHLREAVTPAGVHAQPADGLRVDAAPYTPSNGLPVQPHGSEGEKSSTFKNEPSIQQQQWQQHWSQQQHQQQQNDQQQPQQQHHLPRQYYDANGVATPYSSYQSNSSPNWSYNQWPQQQQQQQQHPYYNYGAAPPASPQVAHPAADLAFVQLQLKMQQQNYDHEMEKMRLLHDAELQQRRHEAELQRVRAEAAEAALKMAQAAPAPSSESSAPSSVKDADDDDDDDETKSGSPRARSPCATSRTRRCPPTS